MFSRIFIERPKLAMVISIVLILGGVLCMTRIPVAEYPEIAPPSIMVLASYPGASAEEIADTVAAPLESEMNGLENLLYFSSDSNASGSYSLTLTFQPNSDTDIAQVNVQNAIKRAENKLPFEVRNLGIRIMKRSGDMLSMFKFKLDPTKTNMSVLELGNFIRMNVRDELSRINGVSQVEVMGVSDYSMRVWLDPMKLSSYNLTPADVAAAIQTQNIQAAAGTVGSEYSNDVMLLKVNALGRLTKAEEFDNIIVKTTADNRIVRLKDVARIELGAEDYTWTARNKSEPMISMAIYRNDDANAIEVVDAIKAKLVELEDLFPEGVICEVGYDPTEYIRASMKEIIQTLLLTLLLVVAITYLFLQNWRATLIPALAIPVSIFATFIFLYPLGFSMNLLTMFALILVIGSLVDDAIVVVENVTRIMEEEHLPAKEATIKSMDQITGAVIATTLVVLAIYVPIAFYGGMVGTIYIQFSVTMCISLCFSTFVALTLSPALCSIILKPGTKSKLNIFAPFNFLLDSSRSIYLRIAGMLVRSALVTLLLLGGILYLNWEAFSRLKPAFLPPEDKGALLIGAELPPGATLPRTAKAMKEFTEQALTVPGVRDLITIDGFSFIGGKGENMGFGVVILDDWALRKTPELQIESIKKQVEEIGASIPAARFIIAQPPAIMGLGATNDVTFMLQTRAGQTPQELETATRTLMMLLNDKEVSPMISSGFSTYNASTPQLFLDVDREKAEAMGIPVSRIFSTLQAKLASTYVNDFNLNGFSFKVKVQAEPDERASYEDIEKITIQNNSGKMVPITSFATLNYQVGPRVVSRFNQSMSASFNVSGLEGISSGQVMEHIQKLVRENLKGYKVEWTGMSYQERGNEGKVYFLMLLSSVFAYLFLVGQYESWTMPLPVILSVTVAILGALLGLVFTGQPLTIYAQLGLIMLIGLAGKNAILMAEFSKQARESEHLSIREAAMAGGSVRYRAVLMTAWSFVIGVFPMVIASGAGAGSRHAIGITTFYGMVLATVVGIVFIPPLYSMFQRMVEFFSPRPYNDHEATSPDSHADKHRKHHS